MPGKNNRITRFTEWIKNIYTSGSGNSLDLETLQKVVLLNIMFTIGIPLLILFGIHSFINDNKYLGILENGSAVIIIFCFLNLRKTKSYALPGSISTFLIMILFLILFIFGGAERSGHLWSFSLPLFLLFIFGIKKGLLLIISFLFIITLFLLIPVSILWHQTYSLEFMTRFTSSFIIVTITAFFFEYIRVRTNRTIKEKNIELEKMVEELKQVEINARESERRFRELADLLPQPIYEADLQGNVTFLSHSGYEISGYSKDDFQSGFKAVSMFVQKDRDRLIGNTRKIFKRKKIGGIEYRIKKKDGSSFPVIIHSAPIIKNNRICGTRGIIIDITKLKQAEEEKRKLEEKLSISEKMEVVGQLAGGVAHDLNNILSAIVGYPDLILSKLRKNSDLRPLLETIKFSGQKAAAIVQDLLTLARRGVPGKEVINLNNIITDYLESPEFDKLISSQKGIKVQIQLDSSLSNLKGSFIHITKAVMNLVSNAVESMPYGGTVTISTSDRRLEKPLKAYNGMLLRGIYVVLKITDQGVGIPDRSLKRIFEPFYTKKAMGRSGTGLGMTVVWGTVSDHQGDIIIRSFKKRGTDIELYFPATQDRKIVKEKRLQIKNYMGNGETILVVDDEEEQRNIACSLLSRLGYQVHTCSSGFEAAEFMKSHSPDLVVLDMIMDSGEDGLETYKKLKEIEPELLSIITSGYSETRRVKETLKIGAGQYIQKPYTLQGIGVAIKQELKKKSPGFFND